MKNSITYLLLILFSFSCVKESPESQIKKITGYWEIVSVKLPDGTTKQFNQGITLDYINVTGDKGIRKKVTPQIDGSFLTNESFEKFILKIENDSLRLYYETPFHKWHETVLEAKDSILIVQNSDHKIYTYKKFRKFNFYE